MTKLNFKKRVWIVKQYYKGLSASKIALSQNIHRRCVYQILDKYKQFSWDGLKDHKTGRPEVLLNPNAELIILDLRQKFGYGACRIEQILKNKGFGISHRQIEKLLVRNGLVEPNIKKQRPRKWVRFELPNPNDMWHTDWSFDPFSGKNLSVFIDDRTRLVASYGIYSRASAVNSIALLKTGIASYGKPKSVMTDHGSQYYANKAPVNEQRTKFRIALDALGIKHCLARVNRPQTNGKVERFFRSYKEEFIEETFSGIRDYIEHYNNERPHMSLGYKTPLDVWNEFKCV